MKIQRLRLIKKIKHSEQTNLERILTPLKQKKIKLQRNLEQLIDYMNEYKMHYQNTYKNSVSLKAFELLNEQNFLENLKVVIEMNRHELLTVNMEIMKYVNQWQTLKHYQNHLDKKMDQVEKENERTLEKKLEKDHYLFLARRTNKN